MRTRTDVIDKVEERVTYQTNLTERTKFLPSGINAPCGWDLKEEDGRYINRAIQRRVMRPLYATLCAACALSARGSSPLALLTAMNVIRARAAPRCAVDRYKRYPRAARPHSIVVCYILVS